MKSSRAFWATLISPLRGFICSRYPLLILPLLSPCQVLAASDDSILFRAETLTLADSGLPRCVQLGLFLSYRGASARTWSVVAAALDYSAPDGLLTGPPVATLADFGPGLPGLAPTGIDLEGTLQPCRGSEIVNSVDPQTGGEVHFASGHGRTQAIETVNPGTGRVELVARGIEQLFQTEPGAEVLFAVITFPIEPDSWGRIDLRFVPDEVANDGNVVVDARGEGLTAYALDGGIAITPSGFRFTPARRAALTWGAPAFLLGVILSVLYSRNRKKGPSP